MRGLEIATGGVGSLEIAQNAVGASELGFGSVGKDAIEDGGVGANELDEVYERETLEVEVEDGTAHDGAYGVANARVACGGSDDDLLSVSMTGRTPTATTSGSSRTSRSTALPRPTRRSCEAPSTGRRNGQPGPVRRRRDLSSLAAALGRGGNHKHSDRPQDPLDED